MTNHDHATYQSKQEFVTGPSMLRSDILWLSGELSWKDHHTEVFKPGQKFSVLQKVINLGSKNEKKVCLKMNGL